MSNAYQAVKVCEDVYWVGAVDWAVRDFHGYETSRGTTYNAYLVLGERVTLFDTVKAGFGGQMLSRISSVIDPQKIDVIVSNHSEPDHAGELAETIAATNPSTVYASKNGHRTLNMEYGLGDCVTALEDGQTLDLGGLTAVCVETRMCHWPDSMVSYIPERKLLISQDAFGMHLASSPRFADEIDPALLHFESAKYYANILMPLSKFVAKALEKLDGLKLDIDIIAPDHGPIWRGADIARPLDWYRQWIHQPRGDKAVVLYDTMWGGTAEMALAIGDGLTAGGAVPTLMPVGASHRSDVATRLLEAGALLVGGSTLNNNMLPGLADKLTYIKGLKPVGLVGAAFGCYGWSGEAPKQIAEMLQSFDVELLAEPLRCQYKPLGEALEACFNLGKTVGERIAPK